MIKHVISVVHIILFPYVLDQAYFLSVYSSHYYWWNLYRFFNIITNMGRYHHIAFISTSSIHVFINFICCPIVGRWSSLSSASRKWLGAQGDVNLAHTQFASLKKVQQHWGLFREDQICVILLISNSMLSFKPLKNLRY